MSSLAVRVDDSACGPHPVDPRDQRFIYAFWHETLLFATHFRTKVCVLSSHHADGELIAQVCRHLGVGVVRGSTTRGGSGAVWDLLEAAKRSHLALTPDGPQGPRRRVQPGTVYLAAKTGMPIVSFGVGFSKAWRARSWDRFAVPYPFALATCVGAAPVHVPPILNLKALAHFRGLLEERLLLATEEAERWAEGRSRRGFVRRPQWPLAA
jgi:lysophospholipid acyltransferase (LPLAT)-like uncharacterized protein